MLEAQINATALVLLKQNPEEKVFYKTSIEAAGSTMICPSQVYRLIGAPGLLQMFTLPFVFAICLLNHGMSGLYPTEQIIEKYYTRMRKIEDFYDQAKTIVLSSLSPN